MGGILIKNSAIVTMDDDVGVIKNGYVGISDGKIDFVGQLKPEGLYDRVIDGQNKVVMPGIINAHTHIAMTLLRSYADDMTLEDWLYKKIFPVEDKMNGDDIYWGSSLGIIEMIKSGTTSFCDMYAFADRTADAVIKSSMRANLSGAVIGGDDDCDTQNNFFLNRARELFNNFNGLGNGRLKIDLAPHSVYTCSEKYLACAAEFANDIGMDIHTHLSETSTENENCYKTYGRSPAKLMLDCGLFERRAVCAHGVYLSDEDMDMLDGKDVSVVHNPVSNLKLASGVADVPKMLEKRLNIALGTDGTASNNNLDMFEEIKLAAILHKGMTKDPTALKAWEVLEMATVNGARALGMENVGIIREGYKADIILLDFDKPHLMPNTDVVSNIVYAANGSDVDTVIVDGKLIMEGRQIKTLDEEKVKMEFCGATERLYKL